MYTSCSFTGWKKKTQVITLVIWIENQYYNLDVPDFPESWNPDVPDFFN